MGTRDFAFITLCLAAVLALGVTLFREDRIEAPQSFHPARYEQDEFRAVVAKIDSEFREHWEKQGLTPAPRADDYTIARRLSLGLVGTIPSLEEIRELEQHESPHRIQWWLSHLLEDRRYSDYFAERLGRAYVGTENGPFLVYRRRRFLMWLSEKLHENVAYDQVVRELVSDKGLWTDAPAVNFVTVTIDQNDTKQPDPIRLAARTSRAFLGMRIDCLQCHDDRLGNVSLGTEADPRDGLQDDFHQLAAFFSEVQNTPLGVWDEQGADYKYTFLHQTEEKVVPTAVPFLPELLESEGTRRQQLAKWITDDRNKPFARAAVNRTWALMFGRALVEPVDDMPLYADFPPGLETLAEDFVAHNYDLRRLIRIIAASAAFQRDSRADFEITNEHEDNFAVFPLSRLRPEQVAGSTIQTSSLKTIDANVHILFQIIRFTQQNEFINRYGDPGEDEFDERAGTISQRLLMMNGQLVKERTTGNPLSSATRIARLAPDDAKAVDVAYLTALSRHPSQQESEHFVKQLKEARAPNQRLQSIEDLLWILLNSTEFSWNH